MAKLTSQRSPIAPKLLFLLSCLFITSCIDDNNLRILFRFNHQGDSLFIFDPYHVITKDELEPVESDSLLLPLGISQTEEHFLIEQLSNGNLTLKSPIYRLRFRKY